MSDEIKLKTDRKNTAIQCNTSQFALINYRVLTLWHRKHWILLLPQREMEKMRKPPKWIFRKTKKSLKPT
ncbi:MAG: hypothetical protein LKF71_08250 [Oscillospiraceae bacterium]|nr:hypothetical protein [Oscillospiraceae bacterium]